MQPPPVVPLQAAVSMLEKTPDLLETLLRDLPQELLQWKPAADRWSISEVLAHIVEIEQLYGQRTRRMVLDDSPVLPPFLTAEGGGQLKRKQAHEHLERFLGLRRAFVFYLRSIPSNAASRTGRHHELGTITISQMLHELANHDLGHIRQIAELYRAHAFYPHAGPFQKYSHPKP
jgi:hypothetical protein